MDNPTMIKPLRDGFLNINMKTSLPLTGLSENNMVIVSPLVNREYEALNWTNTAFNYPNMIRIRTLMDGSCFFHAIAKSYFTPYKIGQLDGQPLDKMEFIRKLRQELSIKLEEPINPNDPTSPRHYDVLRRGTLNEFSKGWEQYSLENMRKELDSNSPVDNVYIEFISNILNKDIYILDYISKDIYITGNDDDILYKNRDSIVLLFFPGHFELIGLQTDEGIRTLFKSNNDFISSIKSRMIFKRSLGSRIQ